MPRAIACLLGLSLVLGTADTTSAQSTEIGFLGGVNFANSDTDGLDSRTGFHAGGFINFEISDILSIQPEVLFVQKGSEAPEDAMDGGVATEINYIEIPILAQFSFPAGASTQFHLMAGPAIGFEVGCDLVGQDEGVEVSLSCDEFLDALDDTFGTDTGVNSVDFGIIFGAGVSFPLGTSANLFIDGTFDIGLTDVFDIGTSVGEDVTVEGSGGKNRNFSISAGVGFPIG